MEVIQILMVVRTTYRVVYDNVQLKRNNCEMDKQLPLNGPWKGMKLDKLNKFRTGLPVSKGVLQRWGATRLEHQAIRSTRHHLPEITTTDYSADTVIVTHSIRALSEIFHSKGTPWRAGQVYKPTFELTHNIIRINICNK